MTPLFVTPSLIRPSLFVIPEGNLRLPLLSRLPLHFSVLALLLTTPTLAQTTPQPATPNLQPATPLPILPVFQFPSDKIPRIDGDPSDWAIVPDSYTITLAHIPDSFTYAVEANDAPNLQIEGLTGTPAHPSLGNAVKIV
jgi:hypothetical protein